MKVNDEVIDTLREYFEIIGVDGHSGYAKKYHVQFHGFPITFYLQSTSETCWAYIGRPEYGYSTKKVECETPEECIHRTLAEVHELCVKVARKSKKESKFINTYK